MTRENEVELFTSTPMMTPQKPQQRQRHQSQHAEKPQINRAGYRELIRDCLNKQMYSTAIFYAEKLSRTSDASVDDQVLFAKCFQLSGEHRRCLVTLEHRGLLSAQVIDPICEMLKLPNPFRFETASTLNPSQHGILSAVYLAACCLFHLQEPEDTLTLLEPFINVEEHRIDLIIENIKRLIPNQRNSVNLMAGMYFIAGKCFDLLENRHRCLNALTIGLKIDPACIEIAEYISSRGLLSQRDGKQLLKSVVRIEDDPERSWLQPYYSFLFDNAAVPDSPTNLLNDLFEPVSSFESSLHQDHEHDLDQPSSVPVSAMALVQQAEFMYSHQHHEEAYRLARQAYSIDPYDSRGNLIYIATMVDLGLKNELFYLGHELVHTHPKLAISWYTVACYYWTSRKFEFAQKYLHKATKIDKRFSNAWVLLGHVLAAQEESEHAISAYRTACRVLPGNHEPQVFMAKELIRTNNYSLALHVLTEALELCPNDPAIMNELGVVYLQLNRLEEALGPFRKAAEGILISGKRGAKRKNTSGAIEIFSNYATCLRKCGLLDNALEWYSQCLAYSPTDAMTHANIAFTLHLSRRFDEAIEQYHRALSLQPSLSFCGDMLSQALEDLRIYSADTPHQHSNGGGDNFLNSLLHTSSRPPTTVAAPGDSSPDMNVSSFLLTPTQQQRHQLSFENSFFIHEDEAMKSGRGTGVGRSEEEDEEFSGISDDQHRQEEEEQQREGEEDSFSVESYSRIAGRLSLDSSSGFG